MAFRKIAIFQSDILLEAMVKIVSQSTCEASQNKVRWFLSNILRTPRKYSHLLKNKQYKSCGTAPLPVLGLNLDYEMCVAWGQ